MTTKLKLFNAAASHLGQERLTSTSEDVHVRRELDAVYDDAIQEALEMGLWLFAIRTVSLVYDPDIDADAFSGGRRYGFTLPDDFVRIAAIANDPDFNSELMDYDISGPGKTLYTGTSTIYLRYVSNGIDYGLNLGNWPQSFAVGVGYLLANKAAVPVTKDRADRNDFLTLASRYFAQAKVRSAVDEAVKTKPAGRLVRSRFRYSTGTRGSLRDSMNR